MSDFAFKPTPPDDSALVLQVTGGDHGQFTIENGPGHLGAEFDRYYVHLSGYCGAHNPGTFAAAPELLIAAERALPLLETLHSLMLPAGRKSTALRAINRDLDLLRAAISKARSA